MTGQELTAPSVIGIRPTERDLAAALPVPEKVRLLSGADSWRTHEYLPIGLRAMVTSDGPNGVRGPTKDEHHPSACLPCPSALGATWDADLVHQVAAALGAEARSKAVDVLLAPTVNLMRTPLGGRGFEFFAEDPVLTASLAAAYVRGVQSAGVAATVKHFVANDSETQRWTYDVRLTEGVLRELYLVPFEACVREAGAWLVMAAYNKVNGTAMTENVRLLRDVLKNEWGFDGVVTSDWHAARSTHATALATLDLSMPGPDGPWGELLVQAFDAGQVTEDLLNDKVARLLRLARRVGALTEPTVARGAGHDGMANGAAPAVATAGGTAASGGRAAVLVDAGLLRCAAAESFVLLRNSGGALPLNPGGIATVAVVGPNSVSPVIQGGGSAGVSPVSVAVPVDSVRAALPAHVTVTSSAGCQTWHAVPEPPPGSLTDPVTGAAGLRLEFTDASGAVIGAEHRESANLAWWDGVPDGIGWGKPGRIVLTTTFHPAVTGSHLLSVSGVGGLLLEADGVPVIDDVTAVPDDPVEAMTRPGELRAALWLEADVPARLRVEFAPAADGAGPLAVRLGIAPASDDDDLLAAAERAAAAADAAIVVVGSAELTESEGFDRPTLALPGRQDELVSRVAAVNRATIVVVNSGMPVLMPWGEQVAAILHAWLPGQEFGTALVDVLFGRAEPGGRLPVTIPVAETDSPVLHATPTAAGVLGYPEGLLIGYRGYDAAGLAPRYPFGHGLGYTTWEYQSVDCPAWLSEGSNLELSVHVRNTGRRKGKEVIQVYLAEPGAPANRGRPVRALAAFAAVRAAPGESVRVRLTVPARSFARYDESLASWITPGGEFTVHVGRSSRDLRLAARVRLSA
ncbi:MAG TPA: glycoside hydrolase family 3 C-terminal domain-containing protein [Streptosporangiaceae bacterium]|nr:glycoside hydrolase family 3 C-terminal domain-containing protein [Streptosporangiaceae bacterium]